MQLSLRPWRAASYYFLNAHVLRGIPVRGEANHFYSLFQRQSEFASILREVLTAPEQLMTISKAKTFRNIIYTLLAKGITLVCVALTTTVVARNLSASDYGLVGFATIIIAFLFQFSEIGLIHAAVRRPVLQARSLQTAFTLKIILGSGAFIAALLIAPFARHFLDHPATGDVVRILALNFLVSTIGFVPRIVLTREMNYRALMIPAVAGSVVQCIVAVVLVLSGWTFWAVVIANVAAALATGVVIQFTKRISVRFHWDWPDAQEFLRFCIPLLGSGVLIFLILNLDNFLVGTSLGSTQLGYYALAFTWSTVIVRLLNDTVNSVLLPTLSAIQNDPAAMRRWYLKTIDLTAFIAVIANTALLTNAHWFLAFLGKGTDKWLPAEQSLQILCVYGILRSCIEPIGSCLMAFGDTKTLLRANALIGVAEVILLVIALRSGRIEIVAAAVLVAYMCAAVVYLPFLGRELSIGIPDLVTQIWPLGPALVMGCLLTLLLPASLGSTLLGLAGRGLFTALVVALSHGFCTRFRCFHEARGMIVPNLARIRAI
jgi:lipopolysaccharide exporter